MLRFSSKLRLIRYFEKDTLGNLGLSRKSGIIENQDELASGLYIYDNLFELLFSLCELLNLVKEKRFLEEESLVLAKSLTKSSDQLLREFLKRISLEEKTLVPIVDKLFERTNQHLKNILSGIEYQNYQQNIKEYSLEKEILGFLDNKEEQFTAMNLVFTEIFFLQHYFQTSLKLKDAYCYVHHLLPSACANFRRAEIVSLEHCFESSVIKVWTVPNVGGFSDIFDIHIKVIFNAALSMCTLLIDLQNHSKIFFEEVKVKVEVQGMTHSSNQNEFLIDTFAASSSRRLKLCYHKLDFSPMKANIRITTKNLAGMSSENAAASLTKLESLAATRDIFEKKTLSTIHDLPLNLFGLSMPLSLCTLPSQMIRAFEEKLTFTSNIYSLKLEDLGIEKLLLNKNLRSCVFVIDTKPRAIYIKERPADQFSKLMTLFHQADKSAACYIMYPLVTGEAMFCAFFVRFEKKEGAEDVQVMLVVLIYLSS